MVMWSSVYTTGSVSFIQLTVGAGRPVTTTTIGLSESNNNKNNNSNNNNVWLQQQLVRQQQEQYTYEIAHNYSSIE